VVSNSTLLAEDIGSFKGFTESGREFIAGIVAPYKSEFVPLLGAFVLVEVGERSALLGRITQFFPLGAMTGEAGDEYLAKLHAKGTAVPEDVKETLLRYSVKVKLLGTVAIEGHSLGYRPGVRMLPHLGARVYSPTRDAMKFICNVGLEGREAATIGHYALGDIVFDRDPAIEVRFDVSRLISRRTLVFARAGYGKSNLVKLLIAKLFEQKQDCGMLIFDPEGEYAFEDVAKRPGLADLPGLQEKLVVFTNRPVPSKYERFVAGPVKFDLRDLSPSYLVDVCLPEQKRDNVFSIRLRGMGQEDWRHCIEVLHENGYSVTSEYVKKRFEMTDAPAGAIVNNVTPVIRSLHDPDSCIVQSVMYHLAKGRVVIVDISLLSTRDGQRAAGLLLKSLFDHNVKYFTAGEFLAVIKAIAVVEEAQNVLSERKMEEDNPFVEWVKEGRKYLLGAVMVTQQPGALSTQLLTQADNFFVLHLISHTDLNTLKDCNAHFSDDILAYVVSEPIEGNVFFWSAPDQPYVLSSKLLAFEEYAAERRKETTAEAKITPKEEFEGVLTSLEEVVRQVLESDPRVPVSAVSFADRLLNDRPELSRDGFVAANLWNLRYRVGEILVTNSKWGPPEQNPLLEELGGKWVLKWKYCERLGDTIRGSKRGKQGYFLLLGAESLHFRPEKTPRTAEDEAVAATAFIHDLEASPEPLRVGRRSRGRSRVARPSEETED
jgi:hypothetical protein